MVKNPQMTARTASAHRVRTPRTCTVSKPACSSMRQRTRRFIAESSTTKMSGLNTVTGATATATASVSARGGAAAFNAAGTTPLSLLPLLPFSLLAATRREPELAPCDRRPRLENRRMLLRDMHCRDATAASRRPSSSAASWDCKAITAASSTTVGTSTKNVQPWPSPLLSHHIFPPSCWSTMPLVMYRPSPEPPPACSLLALNCTPSGKYRHTTGRTKSTVNGHRRGGVGGGGGGGEVTRTLKQPFDVFRGQARARILHGDQHHLRACRVNLARHTARHLAALHGELDGIAVEGGEQGGLACLECEALPRIQAGQPRTCTGCETQPSS